MPCTPRAFSALCTSSSLNGLIMAVTSFIAYRPFPDAQPGSDNADDDSRVQFLILINQDSCHRRCSGNLLNRNRFQFTSTEQSCPLPFLIASFAYKKCKVLPPSSLAAPDPIAALRIINWPMSELGSK